MSTLCSRINCRVPANFPKRLKIAAAEEEMTQGELLDSLLAGRERLRQRAAQEHASPFHRAAAVREGGAR